jgi:hypothetical protein
LGLKFLKHEVGLQRRSNTEGEGMFLLRLLKNPELMEFIFFQSDCRMQLSFARKEKGEFNQLPLLIG